MANLLNTKISINVLGMLIAIGVGFAAGVLLQIYWQASVIIVAAAFGYGMFRAWQAK